MGIGAFIKDKYGHEIFENSFDTERNQLVPFSNGMPLARRLEKESSIDLVSALNERVGAPMTSDVIEKCGNWAFDLPAWVGPFETGKIMVVGMEPHIAGRNYQLTYGIDYAAFKYDAPGRKWRFWDRLFKLVGEEGIPTDQESRMAILKRFYITDLCHFAPEGKANRVKEVPNWSAVRGAVANHFLKKEINVVKPSIIVSQGRVATAQVNDALGSSRKRKFKTVSVERLEGLPPHLSVWHLGSSQTARYWNKDEYLSVAQKAFESI